MDITLLSKETRQVLADTWRLVTQYCWPGRTLAAPLQHVAGRQQATAAAGDDVDQAVALVQTCMALPVDYAQYVVPYLGPTPLLRYLTGLPRGWMLCLLSQKPHPKLLDQDHYFPDGFCRQKLLKKVADGCLKDNTLEDTMVQPDYQDQWEQLERDMNLMFLGMQPLDGQDLCHMESLFALLHANGLLTCLHLTLAKVFWIFYNDVMSVRPHLMADHPPGDQDELVKWHYYLLEWIDIKSAGWPNRRLYTTLVAFLTYAFVSSGTGKPLYGQSVCSTSFNLKRCFRYAQLDGPALLASKEQKRFQPPRFCALDLKIDTTTNLRPAILAIALIDAMAYPPPHNQNDHVTKFHKNAQHVEAMSKVILSRHAQREAKFFLCLAQAESSYRQHRHYDVVNTVLEVLANFESYNAPPPCSVLHPSRYMPQLYLLLVKSLAHLDASDTTLLVCFQQARHLASALTGVYDMEFALTLLTLLNSRGYLQQATLWASAILDSDHDNNICLLKQSSHLQAFGVEYVQHTKFAWLDNQLAYLVGFNKFHQTCLHQFFVDIDASVQELLQRMMKVVHQTRHLLSSMQRYLGTPDLSQALSSKPWGYQGLSGHRTTLCLLQLKTDFYEWIIRFVSRKFFGDAAPYPLYSEDLVCLVEKCGSMMNQVSGRHALYLELRHMTLAMGCMAEMCSMFHAVPIQRQDAYSKMDLNVVLHHLNLEENCAGTQWSKQVGHAAFQLYLWMSVGCMFNGPTMRNNAYDSCVLRHAAAHYHHASGGTHYRLPLMDRLLHHVGYCQHTRANGARSGMDCSNLTFPVLQTDADCQCKKPLNIAAVKPSWLPLMHHNDNHTPQHVHTMRQGFVSLENQTPGTTTFPLTLFLKAASTANPYAAANAPCHSSTTPTAAEPHNHFLLHRLLKGQDGCLLAKAVAYATSSSLIATHGVHAHCKVR